MTTHLLDFGVLSMPVSPNEVMEKKNLSEDKILREACIAIDEVLLKFNFVINCDKVLPNYYDGLYDDICSVYTKLGWKVSKVVENDDQHNESYEILTFSFP